MSLGSYLLAPLAVALWSGCGDLDGPPMVYEEAYTITMNDGHGVFKIGQFTIECEGVLPKRCGDEAFAIDDSTAICVLLDGTVSPAAQ